MEVSLENMTTESSKNQKQENVKEITDVGHSAARLEDFENRELMKQYKLRRESVQIFCPFCKQNIQTVTAYIAGRMIYAWCMPLICIGCCWLPWCIPSCFDVVHVCPKCKNNLGLVRSTCYSVLSNFHIIPKK